jgi:ketosteroid isomerase-like protein
MSRLRTAPAVLVLATSVVAGALAGCGESAEAGVEKAFRGYHGALLARDFPAACSYNTPEATAKLLTSLRTQGIEVAGCEDAFAAIYAEEGGSAAADTIGRTVQIQGITATGDDASVSWVAELDGEQRPARSAMRRVDGQWRFVAE